MSPQTFCRDESCDFGPENFGPLVPRDERRRGMDRGDERRTGKKMLHKKTVCHKEKKIWFCITVQVLVKSKLIQPTYGLASYPGV